MTLTENELNKATRRIQKAIVMAATVSKHSNIIVKDVGEDNKSVSFNISKIADSVRIDIKPASALSYTVLEKPLTQETGK